MFFLKNVEKETGSKDGNSASITTAVCCCFSGGKWVSLLHAKTNSNQRLPWEEKPLEKLSRQGDKRGSFAMF